MGRKEREIPEHLSSKLREIREKLGPDLSQSGLIALMGLTGELSQDYISGFEHGLREPTLRVLLKYAKVAGVSTDVLIDDTLKLPAKLKSKRKREKRNI